MEWTFSTKLFVYNAKKWGENAALHFLTPASRVKKCEKLSSHITHVLEILNHFQLNLRLNAEVILS